MSAPFEDTLSFGLEEVRKDLQLLLDKEVSLGRPESKWVEEDATSARTPLDVEMVVEGDVSGHFRLRFENQLGIIMSGLLMMVNENVINDRLSSGRLEDDGGDAIGELGNLLA